MDVPPPLDTPLLSPLVGSPLTETSFEEFDRKLSLSTDVGIESELRQAIDEYKREQGEDGMDSVRQLSLAQRLCREMLASAGEETSERRQRLMDQLVRLGLERQRMEEGGCSSEAVSVVRSRGHSFELQPTRGRNPTCEVCLSTIWRLVHSWRRCTHCGLRAHDTCTSDVRRICAHVIVSSTDFCLRTEMCEERGLAAQQFRCAECSHPLAFDTTADCEPRLCDYTALYFCPDCHWGDKWVMPSRVLHNLDCEPRPVCRAVKQMLSIIDHKPLLNIHKFNPSLFKYDNNLKRVHQLRRNFLLMKCYFISCRAARKLRILQYLCRHQHFVESADLYSLADMREFASGALLPELESIHEVFSRHITHECESCRGNGFYCELCEDRAGKDEVLYPFSSGVGLCGECLAVFHEKCFERKSRHCPRCARRRRRAPPPDSPDPVQMEAQ